jgi:hypothetical protein
VKKWLPIIAFAWISLAQATIAADTRLIKINYVTFSLSMYRANNSGDLTSISFTIQNLENRSLEWVKLRAVIRSNTGELIQSETFEENMSKKPLGPKEARQITHYLTINGFLIGGKQGTVNITVSDFKLSPAISQQDITLRKELAADAPPLCPNGSDKQSTPSNAELVQLRAEVIEKMKESRVRAEKLLAVHEQEKKELTARQRAFSNTGLVSSPELTQTERALAATSTRVEEDKRWLKAIDSAIEEETKRNTDCLPRDPNEK